MISIPFRVRREYFDAVVSGEKDVEYRKASIYWMKRLSKVRFEGGIAVFVCGKDVHRRLITRVDMIRTPQFLKLKDVDTENCLAIHLGDEINLGD